MNAYVATAGPASMSARRRSPIASSISRCIALYYYVDSSDALLALVLEDGSHVIRDEATHLTDDDATPFGEWWGR